MKPHWLFLGCSVSALSFSAQQDISGSKDHVLFPRHPAYYIASYQVNDSLTNRPGLQQEEAPVQGTLYDITYRLKTGTPAKAPGKLELIRFYEERLKTLPGKKTKTFKGVPGRELLGGGVQKGNMEHMINVAYWELTKHGPDSICTGYRVQVTERPVVKEYSSAEISSALKNRGQIALDIRFASGKSVISDVSVSQCMQLAEMLRAEPSLKIGIEGHTDNQGNAASNKKLSEDRALAVKEFLQRNSISESRMSTAGWGASKPVADNKSPAGRARNRRVEIVRK